MRIARLPIVDLCISVPRLGVSTSRGDGVGPQVNKFEQVSSDD